MWQALGVAFMGQSQPLVKRRRPPRACGRAEISTFLLRIGGLPREGTVSRVWRGLLWPCNVCIGVTAWHTLLGVGVGVGRASTKQLDVRHVSGVRLVWLGWIPARAATSRPARHLSHGASAIQACPESVSCAAYPMDGHCSVQSVAFRPSHCMCGVNQKLLSRPTSSSPRRATSWSASGGSDSRMR